MSTVLFIVGPPGVGKTTLARALLDRLDPEQTRFLLQRPKWTVAPDRVCLAGHYAGGTFDGADTVPYNGVADALAEWAASPVLKGCPLTVFDGDRFSHEGVVRFFDRSSEAGRSREGPDVDVRVALLSAPDDALEARRRARGSKQNAVWMAGRATKARRFAEAHPGPLRLDAAQSAASLLEELVFRGFV